MYDEEKVNEDEMDNEELPDLYLEGTSNNRMGSYVAAAYRGQWFLAEVSRDQKMWLEFTRASASWSLKARIAAARGQAGLHVALNEDILLEAVLHKPIKRRGH